MWRIGWAPNIASRWQMEFNLAFKGLIIQLVKKYLKCYGAWSFIAPFVRINFQILSWNAWILLATAAGNVQKYCRTLVNKHLDLVQIYI